MRETVKIAGIALVLAHAAVFADTTVERSCDTASNCRVVVKNVVRR